MPEHLTPTESALRKLSQEFVKLEQMHKTGMLNYEEQNGRLNSLEAEIDAMHKHLEDLDKRQRGAGLSVAEPYVADQKRRLRVWAGGE